MSDPNTASVQSLVDQFLAEEELSVSPPGPCPYLADREMVSECFQVEELAPDVYEALMNRGFRRNGGIVYRPRCAGCDECRQIRVPVADFAPSRSMRRVWRRNADLTVLVGPPRPSLEKWRLYRRYLEFEHNGTMSGTAEEFARFLYASPVHTEEIVYSLGERMAGVSIADRGPSSLSSVYMFFDPAHRRRSLGTYSILWEIDYCRRMGIPYYYLGYYVKGARTMEYKGRFRPAELLREQRHWVTLQREAGR